MASRRPVPHCSLVGPRAMHPVARWPHHQPGSGHFGACLQWQRSQRGRAELSEPQSQPAAGPLRLPALTVDRFKRLKGERARQVVSGGEGGAVQPAEPPTPSSSGLGGTMQYGTVKIAVVLAVRLACLASAQNTQPRKPALSGGDSSDRKNSPIQVPTGVILVRVRGPAQVILSLPCRKKVASRRGR
jgi:hypothetical protein